MLVNVLVISDTRTQILHNVPAVRQFEIETANFTTEKKKAFLSNFNINKTYNPSNGDFYCKDFQPEVAGVESLNAFLSEKIEKQLDVTICSDLGESYPMENRYIEAIPDTLVKKLLAIDDEKIRENAFGKCAEICAKHVAENKKILEDYLADGASVYIGSVDAAIHRHGDKDLVARAVAKKAADAEAVLARKAQAQIDSLQKRAAEAEKQNRITAQLAQFVRDHMGPTLQLQFQRGLLDEDVVRMEMCDHHFDCGFEKYKKIRASDVAELHQNSDPETCDFDSRPATTMPPVAFERLAEIEKFFLEKYPDVSAFETTMHLAGYKWQSTYSVEAYSLKVTLRIGDLELTRRFALYGPELIDDSE